MKKRGAPPSAQIEKMMSVPKESVAIYGAIKTEID